MVTKDIDLESYWHNLALSERAKMLDAILIETGGAHAPTLMMVLDKCDSYVDRTRIAKKWNGDTSTIYDQTDDCIELVYNLITH